LIIENIEFLLPNVSWDLGDETILLGFETILRLRIDLRKPQMIYQSDNNDGG
jgi:hypothetical protein